jgi:hypothetical protein
MEMSDKCTWGYDEWEDNWDTDCGNKFQLYDGGPIDNEFKFCCYCGKPVDEYTENEEEE